MAVFLTWLTQWQNGGDWAVDCDAEAAPAPGDPRVDASAPRAVAPAAPQGDRQD